MPPGSPNTSRAASKLTSCFSRLARAFASLHSNRSSRMIYGSPVVNQGPPRRSGGTRIEKLADGRGDELGRDDGHVMAGLQQLVARAGDQAGDRLDQRRRACAVEAAAEHEGWAADAGQLVPQVGAGEHAVDGGVARGVVAEPAGAEGGKARRVGAQLRRVAG